MHRFVELHALHQLECQRGRRWWLEWNLHKTSRPRVVNKPLTITEARLLPAGIALLLATIGSLVFLSDAPSAVRRWVATAMFIAAVWPLYRFLRPRWVLRLENGKLLYHDLSSKRITEVDLASVTKVRVNKTATFGVGAEGGVGFQNELVLETGNQPVSLPLPFLEVTAAKAAQTVAANAPRCAAQKV